MCIACAIPAAAAYIPDGHGEECLGYGIMVFTIAGEEITTIVGFPDRGILPMFGLPVTT